MTAARKWVSAARPAADDDANGRRTVLLRETLGAVLSPAVREAVLRDAGWDEARDVPADDALDTLSWVDRRLFVRLAERLGIVAADELRQQVRRVMEASCAPPPVAFEPATALESGFRRRRVTPVGGGATVTSFPETGPARVVLWSRDRAAVRAVRERLWPRVEVIAAPTARAVASILGISGEAALVIVDRRVDRRTCEGAIQTCRVIVWGPEGAEIAPLLESADRVVPCSDEADAADVADLAAAMLAR